MRQYLRKKYAHADDSSIMQRYFYASLQIIVSTKCIESKTISSKFTFCIQSELKKRGREGVREREKEERAFKYNYRMIIRKHDKVSLTGETCTWNGTSFQ